MPHSNPPKPILFETGDGAYWSPLTDCYPVTVIEVSESGKRVTVQDAIAKVVKGSEMDGSAEYEYEPNPEGATRVFSLRQDGRWVLAGEPMRSGCRLGKANKDNGYRRYYDPHF